MSGIQLEYVWNAAGIQLEYYAPGMPLEYVWNTETVYKIQEVNDTFNYVDSRSRWNFKAGPDQVEKHSLLNLIASMQACGFIVEPKKQ